MPAVEKQCAVVELDRSEVGRRGAGERRESVACLRGARGRGVTAVADAGERVAADDAVVGGPEPAAGRGGNRGNVGRRDDVVPAAFAGRPRDRQPAIEADAAGKLAGDGPGDVAGGVGEQDVVRGNAGVVGDRDGFGGGGGGFEPAVVQVRRGGVVGDPAVSERAVARVGADDRAPLGPAGFDGFGGRGLTG